MRTVADGTWPQDNNPLHNAPHTQEIAIADEWDFPYTRQQAVYPVDSLKQFKFWPTVGRVDNVYGDRNLMCSCPTVADLCEA